ncbi:MAG: hypothetical protein AB7U76_24485 [Pirellulales bacterium]
MARSSPIQNTFTSGLLSRRLRARTDLEAYAQGLRQALNGLILPHGGFMKRPGTVLVQEVKNLTADNALIPFDVSSDQQYVIEAGYQYLRFFANHGPIESSPGVPYEVATVFTTPKDLRWAQQVDVMYIVGPTFFPQKLTRTSATTFSIASADTIPNGPSNITATTLAIDTGALTATFSADPKVGGLVTADDVARTVRWFDGQYRIDTVTSTTTANITVQKPATNPAAISGTATTDWALGLFSNTDGPRAVIFHDGRLWFAGTRLNPDVIVGSVSDDFNNFDRGTNFGTTPTLGNDDRSIIRRVQGKRLQTIHWLSSQTQGLVIGTSSGEFRMISSDASGVLTPKASVIRGATARGSAYIPPVQIDNQVVFTQLNKRQVFELKYDVVKDNFSSRDLMLLAEDVPDSDVNGRGGLQRLVYQATPDSVIWAVHGDGSIVSISYEPDQKVSGVGGHRLGHSHQDEHHVDADDLCVIQNPDATAQELWALATISIGGTPHQYVIYMDKQFRPPLSYERATDDEKIRALDEAYFVDLGATLDDPKLLGSFTKAVNGVFTVTGHGFSNGDWVKLRCPAGPSQGDRLSAVVSDATANTFRLRTSDSVSAPYVDTTNWDDLGFVDGASTTNRNSPLFRKEVTTITGLNHLEGASVAILADGALHVERTVSGGSITLSRRASIVRVGLPYDYRGETQQFFDGGAKLGTGLGQVTSTDHVAIALHNTMGGKIGIGNGLQRQLQTLEFRRGDGPMDQSPPLFTGVLKDIAVDGGWDVDTTVYWENNDPLPMTVLAVAPRNITNEG